MSEPRIGNILCLNKTIQYSSKRTRYCIYNKTISLRHSCTQKKNAAMFDITHMLMLMAAQCLQVSLQQKGLTLQGILCLLCRASKKRCQEIMCIKGRGGPLHSILLSQQHISI